MNEKRYKAIVALWGIIMLALQAISIINIVGIIPNAYTEAQKYVAFGIAIMMIGLVTAYMVLALNNKKVGHIVGMVAGAVYILNMTVLSIIVGALFIIYCILMIKELNEGKGKLASKAKKVKEENNKENEKAEVEQ